nr:serine/threonine-protein kinase PEPKR2 [Tanacetum cinerariifolium]
MEMSSSLPPAPPPPPPLPPRRWNKILKVVSATVSFLLWPPLSCMIPAIVSSASPLASYPATFSSTFYFFQKFVWERLWRGEEVLSSGFSGLGKACDVAGVEWPEKMLQCYSSMNSGKGVKVLWSGHNKNDKKKGDCVCVRTRVIKHYHHLPLSSPHGLRVFLDTSPAHFLFSFFLPHTQIVFLKILLNKTAMEMIAGGGCRYGACWEICLTGASFLEALGRARRIQKGSDLLRPVDKKKDTVESMGDSESLISNLMCHYSSEDYVRIKKRCCKEDVACSVEGVSGSRKIAATAPPCTTSSVVLNGRGIVTPLFVKKTLRHNLGVSSKHS